MNYNEEEGFSICKSAPFLEHCVQFPKVRLYTADKLFLVVITAIAVAAIINELYRRRKK